jgi:hypothetical protein
MIAAGAVAAFVGVCFFPAGLSDHDSSVLGLGAAVFGVGCLLMAAGFYLKAQATYAQPLPANLSKETATAPKAPPRGACDLCRKETPVIHCKVHQFHLCGRCLAEHYDFRSCVYVPSTRRVETKNTKSMASKAR